MRKEEKRKRRVDGNEDSERQETETYSLMTMREREDRREESKRGETKDSQAVIVQSRPGDVWQRERWKGELSSDEEEGEVSYELETDKREETGWMGRRGEQ
jgi:hypothetical protein